MPARPEREAEIWNRYIELLEEGGLTVRHHTVARQIEQRALSSLSEEIAEEARQGELERAVQCVNDEPELEGDAPDEIKVAWNHDAQKVCRSLVRVTKRNIIDRLRSRPSPREPEATDGQ